MPIVAAVMGGRRSVVRDSFTRGDGATLGTAESGQAWATITGTAFGISSNQATNTDTTNAICIAAVDAGVSNGTVTCTVTRTTQIAGVAFRVVDASNYWHVSLGGANTTLVKTVAGSPTTVATSATTFGSAAVVCVIMAGNSISVLVNGVPLLAGVDAFNASATKHGLLRQQTVSGNSKHDDFSVAA